MKTQWYVVYFKGRSEKKVVEVLNRKNIENFFPVSKVVENWSVEGKIIELPLFDSYIFVRTTEAGLTTLRSLPNVTSLVYWLGKPVIVSDTEINTLRNFLIDHVNVKVEKISVGTGIVRKMNAPLAEKENSYQVINQTINMIMPSLGYKISAEETSNVRIISPVKMREKTKSKPPRLFNPSQIFNNF